MTATFLQDETSMRYVLWKQGKCSNETEMLTSCQQADRFHT